MGAYASDTMDKAISISTLLMEKMERIAQIEQELETKKASENSQVAEQLAQLQQDMEVIKISHEANISAKSKQVQEMQKSMQRYKDVPTTNNFIKEALELNSLLVKQQECFFQNMSHINPYLTTSNEVTDKEIDQRMNFNDLNTRIFELIEWQETKYGRKVNLPEIEETHRGILFTDWDARIKQVKLAVATVARVLNKNIKEMNHILFATNLIK